MEYLKEAFGIAGIILEEASWTLWTVYISFFIPALAAAQERQQGPCALRATRLLSASCCAPGVSISAHCLGLFVYAMIKVYQVASSGKYHFIGDSPAVRSIQDAGQAIPITYLTTEYGSYYSGKLISL